MARAKAMVKKFSLGNVGIAGDPVKWKHIICAVLFLYIYFAFVNWLALPMARASRDTLERQGS